MYSTLKDNLKALLVTTIGLVLLATISGCSAAAALSGLGPALTMAQNIKQHRQEQETKEWCQREYGVLADAVEATAEECSEPAVVIHMQNSGGQGGVGGQGGLGGKGAGIRFEGTQPMAEDPTAASDGYDEEEATATDEYDADGEPIK